MYTKDPKTQKMLVEGEDEHSYEDGATEMGIVELRSWSTECYPGSFMTQNTTPGS